MRNDEVEDDFAGDVEPAAEAGGGDDVDEYVSWQRKKFLLHCFEPSCGKQDLDYMVDFCSDKDPCGSEKQQSGVKQSKPRLRHARPLVSKRSRWQQLPRLLVRSELSGQPRRLQLEAWIQPETRCGLRNKKSCKRRRLCARLLSASLCCRAC